MTTHHTSLPKFFVLLFLITLYLESGQPCLAQSIAKEFWLGAVDPVVQKDRHVSNPSDYMEIFAPPERWPTVAARTSTLEISTQYVLRGTTEEHQALINGLRSNHMKLAGQFGVEEQDPNPACGGHMEGQGGPANAAGIAKRVHDIGMQLDYIDMDEPVTWGRWAPRNKCPKSVEELAQTAASKVAIYHRWFPAMRVNLIDAVGGPNFATHVVEEIAFVDRLAALGVHVDYFIGDVQWSSSWQPAFEELATRLHARGIKVGMYCNGKLSSNSDIAWDRDSVSNCKAAGNDTRISPDLFMIGTWSPYPTKIFPENEPGTLTHIGKQLIDSFH